MRRTGIATMALVMVTAAVGTAVPSTATPAAYDDLVRIEGDSPRAAAIAISQGLYPGGEIDAAVLARQDTFPDALGAAALTADIDGPLLLTDGGELSTDTETELVRVVREGGTVYLMGGEAALGRDVEARLRDLGFRTPRFPGRDRIETAAQVARFVDVGVSGTVVLVRAFGDPDLEQGWVDSVSCGGWAASTGTPILLTRSDGPSVAPATLDAIDALGVRRVEVCGGAAAVSDSQAEQLRDLGLDVDRHAGDDRAGTAVAVATELWGVPDRSGSVFLLVPGYGTDFGYGLVAAPLSARLGAPILLVDRDEPTSCGDQQAAATICHLETGDARAAGLVVVAPTSVISDDVVVAAAEAADLPRDRQPPTVPGDLTVVDRPEDGGDALVISWKASVDASGQVDYVVRLEPTEGDPITVPTTDTQVVVGQLTPDTTYNVTVVASDVFGNTSAPSEAVEGTPTDEVPAKPAAAPNGSIDGNDVTITWFPAPEADAAEYVVQRFTHNPLRLDSNCQPGLPGTTWQTIGVVDVPTTTLVDENVSGEVCYRYAVRDDTGNRSPYSGVFGPVSP